MSIPEGGGRFVRILTSGKALEAIEAEIVRAVSDGHRVLVKVAAGPASPDAGPGGAGEAIAGWAQALSQQHGLAWQRVGADVLFRQPVA